MFGVCDTNERPLLAGTALCASLRAENIGRAILMFLKTCEAERKSLPTCFLSKEEKSIDKALQWVETQYKLSHPATKIHRIYDLEHFLCRLDEWLKRFYDDNQTNLFVRLIEQLTKTFNRKIFNHKWSQLLNDAVLR